MLWFLVVERDAFGGSGEGTHGFRRAEPPKQRRFGRAAAKTFSRQRETSEEEGFPRKEQKERPWLTAQVWRRNPSTLLCLDPKRQTRPMVWCSRPRAVRTWSLVSFFPGEPCPFPFPGPERDPNVYGSAAESCTVKCCRIVLDRSYPQNTNLSQSL